MIRENQSMTYMQARCMKMQDKGGKRIPLDDTWKEGGIQNSVRRLVLWREKNRVVLNLLTTLQIAQ